MGGYPLSALQRYNYKHLNADIFWWGLLAGSTIAFISVYLARLGATAFQLALLAAGPAVVNLLFSLPAGHWMRGRDLRRTTLVSSILFRLGYMLVIFLPRFFDSTEQVWAVIVIYLLAALPGAVLAISFNAMFAELVVPEHRAMVVGRRSALLSISLTATSLLVAWMLDTITYPLNYQLVFSLGLVGAALSTYHISKLKPVENAKPANGAFLKDQAAHAMQRTGDVFRRPAGLRYFTRLVNGNWLRLDLIQGPFGMFLFAYLAFYTTQYLPTPLFPLYFVNELGISDGVLSLGGALYYLGVFVISLRLPRYERKFGKSPLLFLGVVGYAVYPLLLSMWGTTFGVLTAHTLGGFAWGFAGTSTLNHLMEKVPADDRPAHMALNHITLNVGILLGSFLGPALGLLVGIKTAVLLAGVLRIFTGVLVTKQA